MTRPLSLFLDVIRFGAALLVFLHHASFRQFGTHLPWRFALSGTEPVIVFFVLSGFVIAYTAETKDLTFREYWVSRLARLLSVSLTAIALTLLFDRLGRAMDPTLYGSHWNDASILTDLATPAWIRIATTASFTNEVWWLDLWPGTNSPFWSLGYEVAYYLIFSVGFYLRGATRAAWLGVSVLAIGPKILLLFPVWLLGVLAWKIVKSQRFSAPGGYSIIALSLLTYALFQWAGTPHALQVWLGLSPAYGLAAYCLGDLVTGLLFAACIIGFAGVQSHFSSILQRYAKPIRTLASMTFSLYLLHYPLVYALAALCRATRLSGGGPLVVVGGTLAIIFLISRLTEIRKDAWRPVISRLMSALWPQETAKYSGAIRQ